MLTHLSLFSGIGGIDLAAEWAGFTTVAFCEMDDYCVKVLNKHWPEVPACRDVKDLTKEWIDEGLAHTESRDMRNDGEDKRQADREVNPSHNAGNERRGGEGCRGGITLISGGFPCQPFSCAGARRGEDDPRHLWPQFRRVIGEVRPRWVVAENVSGLRSIDSGRVFGRILSDLAALGYRAGWISIRASDVGAPHRRERVFIVAHSRCELRQGTEFAGKVGVEERGKDAHINQRPGGTSTVQAGTDMAHAADDEQPRCRRTWDGGSEPSDNGGGPAQPRMGQFSDEFPAQLVRPGGGVNEDLRVLRNADGAKEVQRALGGQWGVQEEKVLLQLLLGIGAYGRGTLACGIEEEIPVLAGRYVRNLWGYYDAGAASCGRKPCPQRLYKPDDVMRVLSYQVALGAWEDCAKANLCLPLLRQTLAEIGYVPETLSAVPKVWQSLNDEEKAWVAFRVSGGNPWPATYGQPQYEWEPPRLATGVKDRVARLKALGNAVVPAQVYPILAAIAEMEGEEA